MSPRPLVAAVLGVALPAVVPCAAQPIADRVAEVDRGWVVFSTAAREGLCGDRRGGTRIWNDDDPVWEADPERCVPGPIRVALRVSGGRVAELDAHVGGRWRSGVPDLVDLGLLEPPVAVDYLLDLARSSSGEVGEDAIFPAAHVRGVDPWPRLLAIARTASLPDDTREAAIFWLGQAAGERVAADLGDLVDDDGHDLAIREAAIVALSQLDDEDRAVDELVRVVRTSRHPRLVERALFWLADSESPRALDVIEEILTGR